MYIFVVNDSLCILLPDPEWHLPHSSSERALQCSGLPGCEGTTCTPPAAGAPRGHGHTVQEDSRETSGGL